MKRIALTSPAGKVGGAMRALAAERGIALRSLARDPARLTSATGEVAAFDFGDASTYGAALRDIDVLILIAPNTPRQADEEIALIEAGRAVGVEHIVKLSAMGAEPGGITFADIHKRVERHCKAENIPYTFLRPTFFMQNALAARASIESGIYSAPLGTQKIGQIDAHDIADVALTAALDPAAHAGKIYELSGSEALTGDEIAAALTAARGKPVRYVDLTEAGFRATLELYGADAWTVKGNLELYQAARAGYTKKITGDVETVTGHAPTRFSDWARAAFGTNAIVR